MTTETTKQKRSPEEREARVRLREVRARLKELSGAQSESREERASLVAEKKELLERVGPRKKKEEK